MAKFVEAVGWQFNDLTSTATSNNYRSIEASSSPTTMTTATLTKANNNKGDSNNSDSNLNQYNNNNDQDNADDLYNNCIY